MLAQSIVHIASLPSLTDLQRWQQQQIDFLLNVSGIDLTEIYPPEILTRFTLAQFTFADVFTPSQDIKAALSTETNAKSADAYLQVSSLEHQQNLLAAIRQLIEQLQTQTPCYVFCHRGLGRSPLVTAAAMQYFYRESIEQAIARTLSIRPNAQFTSLSLSALDWCAEQLSRQNK